MKNLAFLFGAYLIFWAGTIVYIWILRRRQKELDQALAALAARPKNDTEPS